MDDPFDLRRFLDAQDRHYDSIRAELRRGRKESHWMWYVFPQLAGLGFSAMTMRYAISGRDEALAYLKHEVLGPRLLDCTRLVLAAAVADPVAIFGSVDALKFRSSMTLFDAVAPGAEFAATLARFYAGAADPRTLALLAETR